LTNKNRKSLTEIKNNSQYELNSSNMNNSNVGQNDLSLDVKVQNDEPGFNVMRAVSENVNLQ
jgi:hypothetical protein